MMTRTEVAEIATRNHEQKKRRRNNLAYRGSRTEESTDASNPLDRRHRRKVKILERGETMGDVPTRRPAAGKRYASNLDRVTLCYVRFRMLFPE